MTNMIQIIMTMASRRYKAIIMAIKGFGRQLLNRLQHQQVNLMTILNSKTMIVGLILTLLMIYKFGMFTPRWSMIFLRKSDRLLWMVSGLIYQIFLTRTTIVVRNYLYYF